MPFIRDFFQNLFGRGGNNDYQNPRYDNQQPPKNEFRNPIWQNTDDNDDEYGDDYRRFTDSNQNIPFQIFTSPFGIMKYFEAQMNNMLKDMIKFELYDDDDNVIGASNDPNYLKILPAPHRDEKNIRDQFLKPNRSLPPLNDEGNYMKVDMDLDGKLTADDISQIFKNSNATQNKSITPHHRMEPFQSSITMEQYSTVIDGSGNTETIVKRQIGDKIHTIITKRDKNGVETKTENITNLDEHNSQIGPKIAMGTLSSILLSEFFGSDPKF